MAYMQVFMVVIKMTKKVAQSLIDVGDMVFIVTGIKQVEEAL